MWLFRRKRADRDRSCGPVCSECRSTHTIVVSNLGSSQSEFVKVWRGQRFFTCRCLDCGQEFYTEEPREGFPDEVFTHDEVVDDEAELKAAEDELKRQVEDNEDRRCR